MPQLLALEQAAIAKAFAMKRKEAYKLTLDNQDGASRFASVVSVSASITLTGSLLGAILCQVLLAPAVLLPCMHLPWQTAGVAEPSPSVCSMLKRSARLNCLAWWVAWRATSAQPA